MADGSPMDKRRRQNRDSQRRFRERNKAWRYRSISLANQVGPPATSSTSLLPSSSSASSEHAISYISSDDSSLLSPDSLPPTSNEDVLYRQTQHYNGSSSVLQMSLPSFATQFSIDELSMPSTDRDTSYHQQQDFEPVRQAAGSSEEDVVLSPPRSQQDADLRVNMEPSRPIRPEGMLQPQRRTSASRAEQMISNVENLYEFGIILSIFPEDPSLRNSLRKMKERFRSLVKTEGPCGQRSAVNDMYEGSSQDSDSGE